METFLLLILATAPPAVFMVFIYWMDRHEPESLGAILAAMGFGALSVIPAAIVQVAFESVPLFLLGGFAGAFYESFLLVAPSEELFKFLAIYIFLRKKPFYDEVNDGIVYYGAGAIGFALFENIFYVFDYGFSIGVLRAFTSIPVHTFCGVIIGYHAGLARFTEQNRPGLVIARGLFLAYLTHALFNTIVLAENLIALLFIPLIGVVYYTGYRILRRGRQFSLAGSGQEAVKLAPPGIEAPAIPDLSTVPGAPQPRPKYPQGQPVLAASQPITNFRPGEVVTAIDGKKYLPPKKETWKAVLGRFLLGITFLFWLLAFAGHDGPLSEIGELILGLVILTGIPFMVGLLLELSYRRRKRLPIYLN